MFKKLLLEQIISFENSFNGFIYFLRELPFFEERIPYEVFQHNKFKRILSIITFLFGILMKFVGRFVYAVGFLLIPYIILKTFVVGNTFEYEETVINVFFMMNCVCGSLVNTVILSSSDEDYMMLNVLKIDPKEHYVGELFFKLFTDFGLFFAVLSIIDIGIVNSLILVVIMTAFRCIGELLSLLIYAKIPYLYKRIVKLDVVVILICVYFAYVSPYQHGRMVSVDAFVFNPNLLASVLAAGVICFVVLCNYKHYPRLAKQRVQLVDVEYNQEVQARARIRAVEANTNVTGAAALLTNRHEKKHLYSYLNHIFFDRNKKLLTKSRNHRVMTIIVISLIVMGYVLYVGKDSGDYVFDGMKNTDTIWFFLMYLISCANRMCRAMFYNCDKDMMRYDFYHKKRALVANYLTRTLHFILLDLVSAGTVIVSMVFIALACGHIQHVVLLIPSMVIVVLFSVMCSIYHTAMYHVFQPYNEKLEVKSAMFRIANVLVGIIGLVFWELPLNAVGVIVFQLIGLVVLFGFSYLLVKEFGAGNFYVKFDKKRLTSDTK